jgi:hypothetical protein
MLSDRHHLAGSKHGHWQIALTTCSKDVDLDDALIESRLYHGPRGAV